MTKWLRTGIYRILECILSRNSMSSKMKFPDCKYTLIVATFARLVHEKHGVRIFDFDAITIGGVSTGE